MIANVLISRQLQQFFHHVVPYILTSISCYVILFGHFNTKIIKSNKILNTIITPIMMACKETIMSCAFAWRAIERQNNKVMDSSTQPRNTEGTASLWIYIRKPLPLSIIRSTVSIGNTLSLHLGSRPDKAYSDYSGAICIVFSLNTSNCWFLFLNPTSQYKWLSWEERCSIMFQLSRLPQ